MTAMPLPIAAERRPLERAAPATRPLAARVALIAGTALLVLVAALHVLAVRQGPAWRSPLLIGDHLFDLLLAAAILWYALAAGRRIGRLLGGVGTCTLGDGLAALGLGLGALSLGILGLGLLHLYYGPVFAIVALALTLWLRGELWGTLRSGWVALRRWVAGGLATAPTRIQRMAVLILTLALLPLWIESALPAGSGPIVEWDAPAYHLAGPKLFLAAHGVVPLPEVPLANAPSGLEMFYVPGLLLRSDGLGRELHLCFVVLLALAAFAVARRSLHPAAGWLAALMAGNVLWLIPEAPSTMNDCAAAFLLVVGVGDILVWLERARRVDPLLLRGSLLLGFSVSFKMVNVPVIPALALTAGVFLLLSGAGSMPVRVARAVVAGLVLAAGAAAPLAPWLLKNLAFFGHPLYPLAVAVSYTVGGQGSGPAAPSLADHARWTVESLFSVYGASLGPPALLLVAAPFVLRGRGARAAMLFLLIGGVLWLWVVPLYGEPRYYIGLIALAAAVAAGALCRAIEWLRLPHALSELPVCLYLLAHSVLMLCLAGLQMANDRAPIVFAGGESRDAYLAAHVGPYLAEQYINRHLPQAAMVVAVHTTLSYYLDRPHLGDWYSSRRLSLEAGGSARRAELGAWCRAGVRYALINVGDDHDAAFGLPMPISTSWLRAPGLHARVLYQANNAEVVALTPCGAGG